MQVSKKNSSRSRKKTLRECLTLENVHQHFEYGKVPKLRVRVQKNRWYRRIAVVSLWRRITVEHDSPVTSKYFIRIQRNCRRTPWMNHLKTYRAKKTRSFPNQILSNLCVRCASLIATGHSGNRLKPLKGYLLRFGDGTWQNRQTRRRSLIIYLTNPLTKIL